MAPSPKQGASGKGQGQGQNKAGGAYDSDAERNKPRRRKQRRTHRRAAETVDGTAPAVEGEGPMEDGGVGQGRVHVRHHKSHRSHGSTSHGQSTMTSARVSPPRSHRSLNCFFGMPCPYGVVAFHQLVFTDKVLLPLCPGTIAAWFGGVLSVCDCLSSSCNR